MIEAPTETAHYRELFERHITPRIAQGPAWLGALRQQAIHRFEQIGFPTQQHEDWRFTNLANLARLRVKMDMGDHAPFCEHADACLGCIPFGRFPAHRLVFINGRYAARFSCVSDLPPGVRICSLADALRDSPDKLALYFQPDAADEAAPFAALNLALFQDGAYIELPPGQSITEPVQIVHLACPGENGLVIQPRNLIIAGANSKLTLVECYVSTTQAPYFTNVATDIIAGEGSALEHLKFQDESHKAFHLASFNLRLKRASQFIAHSIAMGGRLSRNNIRARLEGEGVECVLNGLYLTTNDQQADHHMLVEHLEPHCASHEYFNGILDNKSKGVFYGRILVHPKAQKTDAKQTNRNLLLSDDATVNTQPQLEIYADDVKCTHGATVGQMDEESIFYLRSRGIGLEQARRMLMHAFAQEIIDRVRCIPAREELDRLVRSRLARSLQRVKEKNAAPAVELQTAMDVPVGV